MISLTNVVTHFMDVVLPLSNAAGIMMFYDMNMGLHHDRNAPGLGCAAYSRAGGLKMVGWKDPARVAADYLALVKLVHVMTGISIWEILINLPFDLSIFTGKRRFRWTFMLYLGCRWSPIFCLTAMLVGFDVSHKINCMAWVVSVYSFAYLSFMFASALIVLRIAAIWGHNKFAVGLASATWLTSTGLYMRSTIMLRAVSNPQGSSCVTLNTGKNKVTVLVTVATDTILLGLMLGGLLRWTSEQHAGGTPRFLYNQGLVWLVVVALAEVPAAVFIMLDLNDPLNLMFTVPAVVIKALGAAHIYRALAEYSSQDIMCTTGADYGRASEQLVFARGAGGDSRLVPALGASSGQILTCTVDVMDSLPVPVAHGGDKMTKPGGGFL
ncbi:hypothetical protein BC834DRAFT_1045400 [Gloeopeniophorella convolvens]|nr:hypothetical protein BC834DRAFT_1045400 [Gloeopeniophorella convolvens]